MNQTARFPFFSAGVWLLTSSLFSFSPALESKESEDLFDLSLIELSSVPVTVASAFAETYLDSSATVSVVLRDDWQKINARSHAQALSMLPGIMLLPIATGGDLIQVRGYESISLRGRATLVDGVPINTFAFGTEVFSNSHLQLDLLNSIEVIRGPGSVLYGSDAFHSVVSLNTFESRQRVRAGGFALGDRHYGSAYWRFSEPLAEDHTVMGGLSVSAEGDQAQTYRYLSEPSAETSDTALRDKEYESASGFLKYKGRSGGLNWYAGLFVDDLQTRRFEGGGQVLGGDIQNKDTADKFGSLVMSQAGLRQALGADYEWHLDSYFWRNDYGQSFFLNSAAGFTLDKQHFIEQRKGISIGFRPILVEGGDDTRLAPTQGHDIAIRLGFENAAIVDHMNEKIVLSDGSVNDSFVSYKGLEQDILSLSVENKIALDPQHWKLLWGARLDDYSSFGAQISPRFGLIWLPTRHLATKLLYGEAFRAPNANEIRGTSFVAENTSIEPETLKNLELVFSYLCNSQRIELTAFHSLWEDRILLAAASDTPLGRRYINSGKSESEGLELTLHHQFTDWYFDTTASYIVNTNRDSGQENTVFPKLMLNAGVGFDWPQQGVSVYWSHQLHDDFKVGDQALSAQPLADGPIYYRSDVNISQSFNGGYSIYLGIRNIFDRENTLPSVVNSYDGVSGLSRQLVLGFRYDFADSA